MLALFKSSSRARTPPPVPLNDGNAAYTSGGSAFSLNRHSFVRFHILFLVNIY
jgi:hypothetical protein